MTTEQLIQLAAIAGHEAEEYNCRVILPNLFMRDFNGNLFPGGEDWDPTQNASQAFQCLKPYAYEIISNGVTVILNLHQHGAVDRDTFICMGDGDDVCEAICNAVLRSKQ